MSKEEGKVPQVQEVSAALADRVEQVEKTLDVLEERLKPILQTEDEEPCNEKNINVLVPLASMLHASYERLTGIHGRLSSLVSRLEV